MQGRWLEHCVQLELLLLSNPRHCTSICRKYHCMHSRWSIFHRCRLQRSRSCYQKVVRESLKESMSRNGVRSPTSVPWSQDFRWVSHHWTWTLLKSPALNDHITQILGLCIQLRPYRPTGLPAGCLEVPQRTSIVARNDPGKQLLQDYPV